MVDRRGWSPQPRRPPSSSFKRLGFQPARVVWAEGDQAGIEFATASRLEVVLERLPGLAQARSRISTGRARSGLERLERLEHAEAALARLPPQRRKLDRRGSAIQVGHPVEQVADQGQAGRASGRRNRPASTARARCGSPRASPRARRCSRRISARAAASIGDSFQPFSGSSRRSANRFSCFSWSQHSQYLNSRMPSSTSSFSNTGAAARKACDLPRGWQKPITCSTPARLYQRTVEQRDLAGCRQVRRIALEVPLAALAVARLGERDDLGTGAG